ncbi:hypothetical protein Tco_1212468 [Tanacetum coccineum]
MMILENKLESLKLLENKLESMKILENELESLKLQENQPGDGLMSADVARAHGGDGGGDDRPPPYQVPTGCGGCLGNRGGKATESPYLGLAPRGAGCITCQETGTSGLKAHHAEPAMIYNGKKDALKERYWVLKRTGTYDLERSGTRTIPSWRLSLLEVVPVADPHLLFDTYCWRRILEPRGQSSLCSNTPTGVPYTEDEIMAIVRGGKQRGHIPGVGRVLLDKWLTGSDDKFFSDALINVSHKPELQVSVGSWDVGVAGCGDDVLGDDEDGERG